MPIELTCPCGKRLQVAGEFAGKQGRCPACGGLLQIPGGEALETAPSQDPPRAGSVGLLLAEPPGPGRLEQAVTPAARAEADLPGGEGGGVEEADESEITAVGCVLMLFTVAVIFGVAIRVVRWRDPATGEPLPRSIAIFLPILIGAAVNGIAAFLLRVLGLRVLVKKKGTKK